MVKLTSSDAIWEQASEVFAFHDRHIRKLIPVVDIQHTGSTAMRGALTKGDVDIQARISAGDFENSRRVLGEHYEPHRRELWTGEMALFHYDEEPLPVGIALVVDGSGYDQFDRLRNLLREDEQLLERYNQLKQEHEGASEEAYRSAKADFFGPLGMSHLLD